MLSGALTFSSLRTTRQGLRDIALYAPFIARAAILRRRYLTISLVRLGQAGEKSCFSSSRVRQQLPAPMALFRFYKGNTIRAFDRDRRSTLMRSSIMIVTSESDKVYEFIAARMILIIEIMCSICVLDIGQKIMLQVPQYEIIIFFCILYRKMSNSSQIYQFIKFKNQFIYKTLGPKLKKYLLFKIFGVDSNSKK